MYLRQTNSQVKCLEIKFYFPFSRLSYPIPVPYYKKKKKKDSGNCYLGSTVSVLLFII